MSKRFSIMAAIAIAAVTGASSFAQVCTTQSKGITFVSAPDEVDAATRNVLNTCQQNPVTLNSECTTNLRCGFGETNPYPSGEAACYTSSHNIGFQAVGAPLAINDLTRSVINQCQQTSVTTNSECSGRLICTDRSSANLPYPSNQVTCTAESKSLRFETHGADTAVQSTANAVYTQCSQNPVTVNTECSQTVRCHDSHGDYPVNPGTPDHHDEIVCRTTSHNIPFEARGPRDQINDVTRQVLNQCTSNPVTINSECNQNLHCE